MKPLKPFVIVLLLAATGWLRATAQVTVDLRLDQTEFLPGEAIPLAVKITNQSGQQLQFGGQPDWLTFGVESSDGFDVIKTSQVTLPEQFELYSAQAGTMYVDIAPHFQLTRMGHYKVSAVLHMPAWSANLSSAAAEFDVVSGVKLWSQQFGVPSTGGLPEMREFSLEKANYLRQQLRLYLQLSDATESRIYKVIALGPMVSFGYPEEQVDRDSRLHVLWQTGAQSFSYCLISAEGVVLQRDLYQEVNHRPSLRLDDQGAVTVVGGVKQLPPSAIPVVQTPDSLPAVYPPAQLPAAPQK